MVFGVLEPEARLLTPQDLSAQLGVPVSTLHRWSSQGTGPSSIKVGKHLRWRQSDVDAWLDAQVIKKSA